MRCENTFRESFTPCLVRKWCKINFNKTRIIFFLFGKWRQKGRIRIVWVWIGEGKEFYLFCWEEATSSFIMWKDSIRIKWKRSFSNFNLWIRCIESIFKYGNIFFWEMYKEAYLTLVSNNKKSIIIFFRCFVGRWIYRINIRMKCSEEFLGSVHTKSIGLIYTNFETDIGRLWHRVYYTQASKKSQLQFLKSFLYSVYAKNDD